MDTAGFRREWERRGGRVVVVQYRDSVSRELPITLARDGVTCFINRVNPDDAYDDFTSALFWATLAEIEQAAGVRPLGSPRAQQSMGTKDSLAHISPDDALALGLTVEYSEYS